MKKHAYLIIANRNFKQVELLVNTLDDARNDIYILIDKKAQETRPKFKCQYSNVYILQEIPVFWGDFSLITAEVNLFKAAASNADVEYSYYHLLSGLDLPLVSQDKMHEFFAQHPNKQFVTLSAMGNQRKLHMRLRKHLFVKNFRVSGNIIKKSFFKIFRKFENAYLFFTTHESDHIDFGSNWVTLSNEFVQKIVKKSNLDQISEVFRGGFLVDELFIPYELKKFHMENQIYHADPVHDKCDEFQGNLRYINWWDGSPLTFTKDNYNELLRAKEAGHFFARKFDIQIDKKIIEMVLEDVK